MSHLPSLASALLVLGLAACGASENHGQAHDDGGHALAEHIDIA